MRKKSLLLFIAVMAVLCFSTVAYCHQPEVREKGELEFSGYINVEYGYLHSDFNADPDDTDESDINAEVGLAFGAGLTKSISGDALILYEEGDEDSLVTIDEAYLSIVCPKTGIWYSYMGKKYLPFADGESSFITDPYTHDLGETRESIISLGAKVSIIDIEIGVFNGDSDKLNDDNNNSDDFFAALDITPLDGDDVKLGLSIGYISDISDTDADIIDSDANPDTEFDGYSDRVGGFSYILNAAVGPESLIVEYVVAEDDFDDADIVAGIATGAKPEALNIEIATSRLNKHVFALKYETTDEFTTLADGGDTDITRIGFVTSYEIHEKATVALEYINAEDDKTKNETDSIAVQLELIF